MTIGWKLTLWLTVPLVSSFAAVVMIVLLVPGCAARARQAEPVAAPAPPAAPGLPSAPSSSEPAPPGETPAPALEPVFFSYDSYTLSAAARAALDRIAQPLRERPNQAMTIEGHCDERGTVEYNLALGERRATAVREYLATAGITGTRLQTISYGKERPFAHGSGEQVWAQNRRAHLVSR